MTQSTYTTIIGAGINGLLTAMGLINAGTSVAVIEKGTVGQEASWAGGGILLPLYPWRQADAISTLVKRSLSLYPVLTLQLKEQTAIDPELQPCGLLITKNPDIQAAVDWCGRYEIPFEAAIANYSGLNAGMMQPLWLPTVGHVRNPRLLKSLQVYLRQQGVRFYEQCRVESIQVDSQRITSLMTSQGRIDVNQLIVAAGAWSQDFFKRFFQCSALLPQITPVCGQMLLFQAKHETLPFMVLDGGHYLIPRRDGKILVGSTVEHTGFVKQTTEDAKSQLYDFAVKLLPELQHCPVIRHWAGLRPGTQEGIPYIAKHPELENLYINAGHFRNGLVMAPASAELMTDLILNRPPQLDPTPYQFDAAH